MTLLIPLSTPEIVFPGDLRGPWGQAEATDHCVKEVLTALEPPPAGVIIGDSGELRYHHFASVTLSAEGSLRERF